MPAEAPAADPTEPGPLTEPPDPAVVPADIPLPETLAEASVLVLAFVPLAVASEPDIAFAVPLLPTLACDPAEDDASAAPPTELLAEAPDEAEAETPPVP